MKLRKFTALAAVLALSVSIAACGGKSGDDGTGPIKIGANFELTGENASFGSSSMKGLKLAIKEINDGGGLLGRQIEVLEADNASKSEESTRAAQKLIKEGAITLIGPVTTGNTMGAVPVAMEKKIPLITTTATNPKVTVDEKTKKVNEWIFRACFIDPFQGEVMANFASNDLKAKTAAIYIDSSSDYSKGLQKFFKETFTKNGGSIVAEEAFLVNDTDFKAVLTRIKETKPDVLYVPGYYNEVGKIVKQAREAGITIPILGGDGWDSAKTVEIAGADALNNTFFSNHYSAEDTAPEIQAFVKAFKAAYSDETPDALAALTYDAVKLFADAVTRANSSEPAKIQKALIATKNVQLMTGKVSLNESHDPVKSAVVLEFKDGVQTFKTKVNP